MSSKFYSALYAGFGGGVLIALLMFVTVYLLMSGIVSSTPALAIVVIIAGILIAVLLILTGMIAVSMASNDIKERSEAREVSINAGLLSGLIGCIVLIILSFMMVLFTTVASSLAKDVMTLQNTTCLCTPALLIFSIIAATLGGLGYYRTKIKEKLP